ncbi:hypothetical protein [Microbacterium sp. Leaf179]|uniref:hypothetical protein n=1 Tax=Microbacterium sp. Leaf179 TaxID=1736288 RepID=UPI0006FE9D0D|nr:hypothetical protein [Microbacterium sp. Leaf179]KQR86893.1 hypothetical protein ASF96_11320 [Microbacterium sp. Leaf179]
MKKNPYTHPFALLAYAVFFLLVSSLAVLWWVAVVTDFAPWYTFAVPLAVTVIASVVIISRLPSMMRRSEVGRKSDGDDDHS